MSTKGFIAYVKVLRKYAGFYDTYSIWTFLSPLDAFSNAMLIVDEVTLESILRQ